MCGVVYVTTPKGTQGWVKALRRLNAHESKRCRLSRGRAAQTKPPREAKVKAARRSKLKTGGAATRAAASTTLSDEWAQIDALAPVAVADMIGASLWGAAKKQKQKKHQKKGRGGAKVRKVVPSTTVVDGVSVHCCYNCGVVYETVSRKVSSAEWTKTLRRLNAHESQRCGKRPVNVASASAPRAASSAVNGGEEGLSASLVRQLGKQQQQRLRGQQQRGAGSTNNNLAPRVLPQNSASSSAGLRPPSWPPRASERAAVGGGGQVLFAHAVAPARSRTESGGSSSSSLTHSLTDLMRPPSSLSKAMNALSRSRTASGSSAALMLHRSGSGSSLSSQQYAEGDASLSKAMNALSRSRTASGSSAALLLHRSGSSSSLSRLIIDGGDGSSPRDRATSGGSSLAHASDRGSTAFVPEEMFDDIDADLVDSLTRLDLGKPLPPLSRLLPPPPTFAAALQQEEHDLLRV